MTTARFDAIKVVSATPDIGCGKLLAARTCSVQYLAVPAATARVLAAVQLQLRLPEYRYSEHQQN